MAICITLADQPDALSSYVYDQDVVKLGRSSNNEVQFDPARYPQVSRHHGQIERTPQGWYFRDLGSKHGSFSNGNPIAEPFLLRHGEQVQLGHGGPIFTVAFPIPRITGGGGTHLKLGNFHEEFTYFPLAFSEAFLGRYKEYHRIGTGGFGEVWRAKPKDESGDRAVKLLRPQMLVDEAESPEELSKVVQRFVREAKLMHLLSQAGTPGIARVYDWSDQIDLDFIYLVMDFIEGRSLEKLLFAYRTVPQEVAANIFLQVAKTLQAAHEFRWTDERGVTHQGIIHRDVKPSNIMIERETGKAYLVDFGIAGIVEGGERLTATHIALGSARFLPLEALKSSKIQPSLDLWGFAVSLYVTLTRGAFPYQARTIMELFEALSEYRYTPLSYYRIDLDKRVVESLERTLKPEVEDRVQSFEEWIKLLTPLADQNVPLKV